ncbi:MAG: response regulator [Candidatus Melainabacteria bacterium]|nr:response regulator [Candidatus Melainabacteria bacterium]
MNATNSGLSPLQSEEVLTRQLLEEQRLRFYKRTGRLFAGLMIFQWLASIFLALVWAPLTWDGSSSTFHVHLLAAIFLGGIITIFPVYLAIAKPGLVITRHIIGIAQMCMSALLIHLSGGRIETHFHIFCSLALLAFYLDWRVLITASLVVALDHWIRGVFWPQSVYGEIIVEPWRWLEHTGWIVFEDAILTFSIKDHLKSIEESASRQASLAKTNERIEIKVHERTQELALTNEKLQELSKELSFSRDEAVQASSFKSDFLANMSHEIRTPLNAVIGLSDLLMRTPLNDEQREFSSIINNSADLLLDLVNDILDYSKIEAGKLDLELIEFDIIELIENTCEIVNERARSKNLTLSSFIDPTISRIVKGDPGRIRQILLNFLSNSIKFTEQGEIVVKAMGSQSEDSESNLVEVTFLVKDTGIGLSEIARERLFQPFTQADNSVTRKYGGTGLGLAISDKLVKLMGGNIEFESVYGKGSTFGFKIKMEAVLKEPGQSLSCPINAFNANRILLVDGLEEIQNVLHSYASIMGVRASVASDMDKALVMMKTEAAKDPFDVILFLMNQGNEESLLKFKNLSSYPQLQKAKLAVISSSNEKEFVQQIMQKELAHFFSAPVKKSKFVEGLVNLLRQKTDTQKKVEQPDEPDAKQESTSLVLVVEDNAANQKVALLQLRELGIPAHAVGNGIEALEAVTRTQYALILMDCQMPEMDGIQATKEIRKTETLTGKRSPIVAMTAHALASDRLECLTAGMDDYISKPVNQKKLAEVLERWMPRVTRTGNSNQEITGDIAIKKRPIEIETLKKTFGAKVAVELMLEFLSDSRRLLQKLDNDLEMEDLTALKMDLHELKGMTASLYASEIAELSRSSEERIRQAKDEKHDWSLYKEEIDEIRSAWLRAKDYIESHTRVL